MHEDAKQTPTGPPSVPEQLVEGIRRAIEQPLEHENARITVVVEGGVRGEHYEFTYTVDATGAAFGVMRDELRGRAMEHRADPDPNRFGELARAIDLDALVGVHRPAIGYPPDSVIGTLEVTDGRQTVRVPFLAGDSEQRARAKEPDAVTRAADAAFAHAERTLGTEDLRP